jgi:hypothetical protein
VVRQCFFFDLLAHIPLHEIVRSVVFFLQANVHNIIDCCRYGMLVSKEKIENILQVFEVFIGLINAWNYRLAAAVVHELNQLQHMHTFLVAVSIEEGTCSRKSIYFCPRCHS